ncbi:sulfatase-like hydrolase/transferase [Streptomyces virginiae]|uniref:sulfatase-like hydrolase/transferase n=1 Tax=Streptomyces virginiae TaxID=1961 RepID=UPI0036BB0ACC
MVFTSDHGEMAGSHGLRQKGNLAYDENFHVPFVIAHPDLAGGARTEALAPSVDIAPTLLEIAGLDAAEAATRHPALKGHSLMPVLHGRPVREGILNVDPEAPGRVAAGELRPDWNKRGFLRAYFDERHTFGRYFSPLNPNRPADTEALLAENDVVLYESGAGPRRNAQPRRGSRPPRPRRALPGLAGGPHRRRDRRRHPRLGHRTPPAARVAHLARGRHAPRNPGTAGCRRCPAAGVRPVAAESGAAEKRGRRTLGRP